MKPKSILLVIAVLLLLSMALAACGGNQEEATVPEENPVATQETTTATEAPENTASDEGGVPEDVPIAADAYDLQAPDQKNVTYKVDQTIADVVAFYQQELENYGWTAGKAPDTVVGNMAQFARTNEAGDRLIFSLQYNPIGEFTIVQISITQAIQ